MWIPPSQDDAPQVPVFVPAPHEAVQSIFGTTKCYDLIGASNKVSVFYFVEMCDFNHNSYEYLPIHPYRLLYLKLQSPCSRHLRLYLNMVSNVENVIFVFELVRIIIVFTTLNLFYFCV